MSGLTDAERRVLFDYEHPACGHSIKVHNRRACEEGCGCVIGSDSLLIFAVEAILAARLAEQAEQIAAAIEANRPEVGLHINVTEYRRGNYDGMTRASQIAREIGADS